MIIERFFPLTSPKIPSVDLTPSAAPRPTSLIWKIFKIFISIICPPLGIYWLVQSFRSSPQEKKLLSPTPLPIPSLSSKMYQAIVNNPKEASAIATTALTVAIGCYALYRNSPPVELPPQQSVSLWWGLTPFALYALKYCYFSVSPKHAPAQPKDTHTQAEGTNGNSITLPATKTLPLGALPSEPSDTLQVNDALMAKEVEGPIQQACSQLIKSLEDSFADRYTDTLVLLEGWFPNRATAPEPYTHAAACFEKHVKVWFENFKTTLQLQDFGFNDREQGLIAQNGLAKKHNRKIWNHVHKTFTTTFNKYKEDLIAEETTPGLDNSTRCDVLSQRIGYIVDYMHKTWDSP